MLFWQMCNIIFVAFIHMYRKYHISMYFLRKIIFHFPSKEKLSYFLEKRNTIVPDITKKIIFQCDFCGKTIFSEHLKKPSYFHVFFLRKIIFPFPSKEKISYFWEKRSTISPDITKKIMFQCDFFRKIIYSEHLEKENIVFCAVLWNYKIKKLRNYKTILKKKRSYLMRDTSYLYKNGFKIHGFYEHVRFWNQTGLCLLQR